MHLLLLDDDDLNNEILTTVLEDLNIIQTLSVYSDGWEALQFLDTIKEKSQFPNLLLIDLKMPTMDGEEFIKKYQESFFSVFPESKLVVLSNSTLNREKDRVLGYESVVDFLRKPIEIDKLKEILESCIRKPNN